MTTFTLDQVRSKAVEVAEDYGWHVDPATCRVKGVPTATWQVLRRFDKWTVTLPLEPTLNPHRPLTRKYTITVHLGQAQGDSELMTEMVEPKEVRDARLREQDAI